MNLKNLELLLAFLLFYGRIEEAKKISLIVNECHNKNFIGIFKQILMFGYSSKEALRLTTTIWKTI